MRDAAASVRWDAPGGPQVRIIGIGELAVSNVPETVIATHAIGSCITVCVFDPAVKVAGMLHFLLPDSAVNPARATEQPGVFADTGIPLLFQKTYEYGLDKRRAIVKLVGGAEMAETISATFTTGRRNLLAARNLLWRNGVFVAAEDVGGSRARTLHQSAFDGRLRIASGDSFKEL